MEEGQFPSTSEESLLYPANSETSSIAEKQFSVEQDAELLPPACKPFISEYGNDSYTLNETTEYAVAAGCKIFIRCRNVNGCSRVWKDYQLRRTAEANCKH